MSIELLRQQELPRLIELPALMTSRELDGSCGTNRQQDKPCQITAQNDFEAV